MRAIELGPMEDIKAHHLIVTYTPRLEWNEAIDVGAPDTMRGANARLVSGEYPRELEFTQEKEIILVNFLKEVQNDQYALNWSKKNSLQPAGARKILAVGAGMPELPERIGVHAMFISSLTTCSFVGNDRMVYLAYAYGGRRLLLARPNVRCNKYCWFAFTPR